MGWGVGVRVGGSQHGQKMKNAQKGLKMILVKFQYVELSTHPPLQINMGWPNSTWAKKSKVLKMT